MKFIFVRFRGLESCSNLQSCLMLVSPELTVSELKSLCGVGSESAVFSPTCSIPLKDEARLYDVIHEFDTVTLAPSWIDALLGCGVLLQALHESGMPSAGGGHRYPAQPLYVADGDERDQKPIM
ncbi:MAG: hypothetical protein A2Z21_05720 [Candidatus Fraserbacteria bacterium RBG_16_55_9]|uniref:Uncharacterized protein n=1 Tax=Fraserbacteria sp. (strain RBG_16_55_9) TaxID=1817864 RepID=A0A1F5UPR7_FRAXR|nr:MAG: hypothetical protein A2Z21_05720 [Candidatus Fraserbacteria bacterium RBG_16_55_9]